MLLRMIGTLLVVAGLAAPGPFQTTTACASEPLPKVVLLGDSIRLGYAPLVAKRLAGRAVVVSPSENGGDSANLLRHIEEWCIQEKPTVVHFNCGLHDLKLDKKTKQHKVELPQYERNLRQLVARLQKETAAALIFADTTPIVDARHAKRKADFDRFEADVQQYNAAAVGVMKQCGVPVHDLHWVVGAETLRNYSVAMARITRRSATIYWPKRLPIACFGCWASCNSRSILPSPPAPSKPPIPPTTG